jgi:hypothetical protein
VGACGGQRQGLLGAAATWRVGVTAHGGAPLDPATATRRCSYEQWGNERSAKGGAAGRKKMDFASAHSAEDKTRQCQRQEALEV